jgi:hypothetical protein
MTQQLRELRNVIDRMPLGTYERSWWDRYFWVRIQSSYLFYVVIAAMLFWLITQLFKLPKTFSSGAIALILAAGVMYYGLLFLSRFLRRRAPNQG